MISLAIIGALLFSYPTSIYLKDKWNKSSKETIVQFDGKQVKTNANAKERLFIPSAYDTIEATHPSVINFPEKWNGFKYWMAVTPYPKGDATKENPHILASNDMVQWTEPKEGINPLDEVNSSESDDANRPKQYNSDTHLIFNEETEQLELFWRYVDDVNNKVIIYKINSKDGTTWTKKQSIYTNNRKPNDWLSPAIVKDKDKYRIWYVSSAYTIHYRDSKDGKTWSKANVLDIPYDVSTPDDMKHWHLDVKKIEDHFEMLVVGFKKTATNTLNDRHVMSLYHSTSKDGIHWETLKPIIYPSQKKGQWDSKGLYRSSFIKEDGKYFIFYSGIGYDGTRGIGLSYGKDLKNLTGVDFSHLEKLHN